MKRQFFALSVFFAFSLWVQTPSYAAGLKVAFTGDQGIDENAQAVLSLIASEDTDLLMIQGDLGYAENSADTWNNNLDTILGADFPVLTLVGNHDGTEWPRYRELIQRRLDQMDGVKCSGRIGVKAACQFDNIEVVQVAPGINEVDGIDANDDYAGFIRSTFAEPSPRWRICSWHKNQREMQTGEKSNGTGWSVFDACLDAGAFIAMGHEHAYSRTHLLSNFETQTIINKESQMQLQPGQSFAFVSGLGGWQVRPQKRDGDWWASIYTATQGATHGALFCTFEEVTAECYFKAIDGSVPDQFSLRLGDTAVASDTEQPEITPDVEEPEEQEQETLVVVAEITAAPATAPPAPEPVAKPTPASLPEVALAEEPSVEEPQQANVVPESANILDQSGNSIKPISTVFSATIEYITLIFLIISMVIRRRA